ncbi:MAG TPA: TatD family hydrolase [Actinomycetota bacterium]
METDAPDPRTFAVDTHCHLFLMEGDTAEVVRAARRAKVERLVCVGIDPDSSRRSLEMAESFRGVFATAGVHPHSATAFDRPAGSVIEELLADPLVVGVGETGLDYYRRLSPQEDQQRSFRTHIALSRETGKPLVVHVREAWDDALRILAEEGAERVVLHCFSGDEHVVREAAARGYFLSFAGNVTYPNAGPLKAAATAAPEGQVLVETDSPFLAPQAARGAPNSPANVVETLAALASLRDLNLDAMVRLTTEASYRAFPLLR